MTNTKYFALQLWTPATYVAFSISPESCITNASLNQIEKILKGFNGTIIFDLALSLGLGSPTRFWSAQIAEGDAEGYFDRASVEVIKPWTGLLTYSYLYYSNHPDLVNSSLLPDKEKQAMLLK